MDISRDSPLYLGIDFGTSGARACVIDGIGNVVATAQASYKNVETDGWAPVWERTLFTLLDDLPMDVKSRVARMAFDGTSGTALLLDRNTGAMLQPAKLYNEKQPVESLLAAEGVAPPGHTAAAAASALSKLMTWHLNGAWQSAELEGKTPCVLHQADWLVSLLTDVRDSTDWNNSLKLGFDPVALEWPSWMTSQPWSHLLPPVVRPPGANVAGLTAVAAARTGLSRDCIVAAGTTDSIAAFLAAGVTQVGEAVTSLGSTMAIKMLSTHPINDARYGIYSHRLEMGWLVGGASNVGGLILRRLFSDKELQELTEQMDVDAPTGLDYYPLPPLGRTFRFKTPT